MACRSVSLPPSSSIMSISVKISPPPPPPPPPHNKLPSTLNPTCGRQLHHHHHHFVRNCFNSDFDYSGQHQHPRPQPQDALLKAIAEVSKREGRARVGQASILVFGDDSSTSTWLALDRKLNSYPRKRGFTAIGTGGDDFVQSMVYAVESVVQRPIPQGQVRQKISSRGKYVSVKIGPVQVASSEQVEAVYYAMKSDERMKYFL